MTGDARLGRAVLLLLAAGDSPFPRRDEAAVLAAFGADGPALLAAARTLVEEALAAPTDWARESLPAATERVRREVAARHPELGTAAVDAVAWAFSYDWR